ncbi:MAG: hypothetical protein GX442_08760, partial [Candidatus Riflebacteria bacterium]|nr:hypothetical protein [Candidatus Riflebacteria bacterium]
MAWLIIFLVAAIPWGISAWLRAQHDSLAIERERDRIRQDLDGILSHTLRLAGPASFLQDRVDRLGRALVWSRTETARLARELGRFGHVFLLGSDGRRLPLPGVRSDLRLVSELCLRLLRQPQEGFDHLSPSSRRLALGFLGSLDVIEAMARQPGRILDLGAWGEPRFGGWFPCRVGRGGGEGFLFVLIDRDRLDPRRLARRAIRRLSRLAGPGFTFGLVDLVGSQPAEWTEAGRAARSDNRADSRLADGHAFLEDRSRWETADGAWRGAELERRHLLTLGHSLPPPRSYLRNAAPGLALEAVFGMAGLLLLGALLRRRPLPVRWQIRALFTIAAVGGVTCLLGFAREYLYLREEGLIREMQEQALAILRQADLQYPRFLDRLSRRLQGLVPPLAAADSPAATRRALSRIRPAWRGAIHAVVLDADGEPIARQPDDVFRRWTGNGRALSVDFFRLLGRDCLTAWEWRQQEVHGNLPPATLDLPGQRRFAALHLVLGESRISRLGIGADFLTTFATFFRAAPPGLARNPVALATPAPTLVPLVAP